MSYVDGFVFKVPKARIDEYKEMAFRAAPVWKEHGAISYTECLIEDARIEGLYSFLDLCNAKDDETVAFSYITYRNRAHRDEVNAKVMQDPRLADMCDPANAPFDFATMAMGGFVPFVNE